MTLFKEVGSGEADPVGSLPNSLGVKNQIARSHYQATSITMAKFDIFGQPSK
jgi:hypothetical protein